MADPERKISQIETIAKGGFVNSDPLVSIVIATCNGARYLPEQLGSVLAQTHKNLEVIISDDCSEDETLKIAREFSASDNRIRIFSNDKRLGVGANFLKALERCQGAFVCFCDQDDYWRRDKIDCLMRLIEQSEETMLVYSDLEVCDEGLNRVHPSFWKMSAIRPVNGVIDERILLRNLTPGCSMMFRRAVMENMMSFPVAAPFLHDHLAFATSCGLGQVLFTDEKLVKYRQHQRNVIGAGRECLFGPDVFLRELRKRIAFFEKNPVLKNRFDLKKMARFCDAYAQKKFWQLPYLGYYLFFHPDNWKGKAQAICESFLPRLYLAMKTRLGA